MTMNEREEGQISSVNTGCRPKVATHPPKMEISSQPDGEQLNTHHFPDEIQQSKIESEIKVPAIESCDPDSSVSTETSTVLVQHRKKHVRSFSDCTGISSVQSSRCQPPTYLEVRKNTLGNSSSAMSTNDALKSTNRPRFLDDGGSSIIVAAGGQDYPKRQRGQSLVEYLMSNQSGKVGPELDRENAHFSVSEAMIAAIEETRFHEWKDRREEEEDDQLLCGDVNEESDEEIRQLKRELQAERTRYIFNEKNSTTDSSISPTSSVSTMTPPLSPSSSVASITTAIEVKKIRAMEPTDSGVSFTSLYTAVEKERRKSRKLARLKRVHSRLSARQNSPSTSSDNNSLSETPLVSAPIDVGKRRAANDSTSRRALLFNPPDVSPITTALLGSSPLPPLSESAVSAENIALSLLGHFSQLHLPNECEMEWLVSEKDAPQHLLPMPRSWPINPDEPFMQLKENDIEDGQVTTLRGNLEWAPPRPQIVFAVYTSPNLKVVMAKQNYRCAGCGMRVEPEYSHNFRYCHYLGRYFCTGCHSNKTSIVPSRIFKKWDFKKYPVSNFSFDLLERMWFDPLFRLGYINPLLYRRCRQLSKVLELRTQLVHVGEFLRICRFATEVWEEFLQQSGDWLEDPEIYSLHDLTRVNSGEMFQLLRKIVSKGMNHIIHCELCQARGFLCEKCRSSEIIFPFQVDNVIRCEQCGSCFHRPCWNSVSCPRCKRIARRMLDK